MKKKLLPILIITILLLAACRKADEGSQLTEPVATAIIEGQEESNSTSETAVAQGEPFTNAEEPCKPFSLMDQQLGTPFAGLPPVTEDDWLLGPEDAAVTLLEYSEPQCPYCAQLEPVLQEVQKLYPDDVRLVYRHRPFPESFHDKSILASQALEAAGKQSLFNDFKNFLFENQAKWAPVAKNDFDAWIEENLDDFEIESTQFFEDMYSEEVADKIQAAADSANSLGINGTPTLLINGFKWPEGVQRDVATMSIFVQLIKSQELEYDTCAPDVIQPDKDYSATISTTKGDITVDLFADIAPNAVNSFVFLAREGWYDGLPLLSYNEFVLSGDPSDTGYGGPGYAYLDELNTNHSLENTGKLATYSLGPGLNGSAFFINKTILEEQQGRTIFGEVTEGMDIVNALELRENAFTPTIDRILTVIISEN